MTNVLDPKRILAMADEWIKHHHLYAADPSADPAIQAVTIALCLELNRIFAPLFEQPAPTEPA